jgi:SAM-dependent methyltransferase
MEREEIEARHAEIVARHGEWSYDIPLGHGFWTRGNEGFPHTRLRRILQVIADLTPKPLGDCRILDLACLDGQFSIECALQGAEVVGIEAREASVVKARFAQEVLGLERLEFVHDDVRNLSVERYGEFDAVICSGILYHLDTPDVFDLIERAFDVTRHLLVIDTHVTLEPDVFVKHGGASYRGERLRERHLTPETESDGPPEIKQLWASVGNETSLLLSRPSLLNALAAVGFSSVHECLNPPHLNFGSPGIEHANRCTFAAVKGLAVELSTSPTANGLQEAWPEGALSYAAPGLGTRLRAGLRRLARRVTRV